MKNIRLVFLVLASVLLVGGCGGYQNSWLYPQTVRTVYVEMFDTTSFRRGHEYALTDAVCKRIESQTPYKIVSNRDTADTVLSGRLGIRSGVLATDRYTGRALEKETVVAVTVTWKDLRTGKLLIDSKEVYASSSFSEQMGQDFEYAIDR
ncbi:MAG TPA: LPS assembly lipoprotein LptE, partial [Anaerohalosphaeraceae bacterium]|nr:LPS assembly lipoprotein LptE [Anaerohalosphaeraceae bacterium]